MPSGRAAWGYAICMVAYQMVEEGVCRLSGQHGDMLDQLPQQVDQLLLLVLIGQLL